MLYQVTLFYACYGIEVGDDGMIEVAPPIAKWMEGEFLLDIKEWVRKKGGTIERITGES